jgi:hypothetical protein
MVVGRFRASNGWDDLPPVPIVAARLGATAPTLRIFTGDIEQYTFDATNDYVIGTTELIHTYEEGSDVEAHVHWTSRGTDVDARYVRFQLKYSLLIPHQVATAQTTLNTGDLLIPGGTASLTPYVNSFTALIPGLNLVIGSYIVFRFERIAAVGTAPTDDPFVIAVGFHARMDSTASAAQYVK